MRRKRREESLNGIGDVLNGYPLYNEAAPDDGVGNGEQASLPSLYACERWRYVLHMYSIRICAYYVAFCSEIHVCIIYVGVHQDMERSASVTRVVPCPAMSANHWIKSMLHVHQRYHSNTAIRSTNSRFIHPPFTNCNPHSSPCEHCSSPRRPPLKSETSRPQSAHPALSEPRRR